METVGQGAIAGGLDEEAVEAVEGEDVFGLGSDDVFVAEFAEDL